MKKILYLLAISFVFTSCGDDPFSKVKSENVEQATVRDNAPSKFPVMTFDKTVHDFGTIMDGQAQETVFSYTNTGEAPLVITEIKSTCGCTVPQDLEKSKLGPHPSGNLSTIINKVCPINKGDIIWTLNLPDLIIIGKAILEGKFLAERLIALAGSCVSKPKYIKTLIGSNISSFLKLKENNSRIISGNVLTGVKLESSAHVRYYSNEITAIPEGNDYDLFGWAKPMFDKFSVSRALTFSWLFPNKKYDLNTNTNGEHRAFVVTGSFEEVFPLDIYPMQILKACMYKDLDEMEALGMYEVSPEDFALTEFICVSKQPHQNIIREGLDLMKKEIG